MINVSRMTTLSTPNLLISRRLVVSVRAFISFLRTRGCCSQARLIEGNLCCFPCRIRITTRDPLGSGCRKTRPCARSLRAEWCGPSRARLLSGRPDTLLAQRSIIGRSIRGNSCPRHLVPWQALPLWDHRAAVVRMGSHCEPA